MNIKRKSPYTRAQLRARTHAHKQTHARAENEKEVEIDSRVFYVR